MFMENDYFSRRAQTKTPGGSPRYIDRVVVCCAWIKAGGAPGLLRNTLA
jgi:hypothetical protein